MKTLKKISILCLLIITFNCSSDDDSSGSQPAEMTTAEKLTNGKWYQESRTPGSFTDCEKNVSFNFKANGTVSVESFDDTSGMCESGGLLSATYSLNGNNLTIDFNGDIIMATINNITSSTMTITDSEGDVIIFDKTQG